MAATSGNPAFQPDSEVHVSYEDQQKINLFAKHNAKFEDLKEELKNKKNELRNLEDAFEELELMDDSDQLPFLIGEVFLHQDVMKVQTLLKESKEKVMQEVEEIEKKSEELCEAMTNLKTNLYAKFGTHINLERDEE